jgi:hypothetical protein
MKAVESVEITILVDNSTDNLSSAPRFVDNEFAAVARRGLKLSGTQAEVAKGKQIELEATVKLLERKIEQLGKQTRSNRELQPAVNDISQLTIAAAEQLSMPIRLTHTPARASGW